MTPSLPITKDIVLIGGGHTHALVLKSWAMKPLAGARVTLITPSPKAAYSGMLPGHIAGHYTREELDIDLIRLCRLAGARIVLAPATGLDRATREVILQGGARVGYDICSIDIGIHSELPDLPGFSEHALAVKPLDHFASGWEGFVNSGAGAVAVLGGGIAGAELALAAKQRLQQIGCDAAVSLVDREEVLNTLKGRARRMMMDELAQADIQLYPNTQVAEISGDGLLLTKGTTLSASLVLGATGARPYPWLAEIGLPHEEGFLTVERGLQSPADPTILAVGDCAFLSFDPRPKAGVFAVRAAPVLFNNLRALAQENPNSLRAFRPQKDYLKLISLGGKQALAEKRGLVAKGAALWRLKDRIDRKFMDQFTALQGMKPPAPPKEVASGANAEAPLCGGCGAKLAPDALNNALTHLPAVAREDVVSTPSDDAAILQMGSQTQILTTDHLRAFCNDPALLARVAAIHALGDCWAMGATPQSALATIILPRLAPPLQQRWLGEIMASAGSVFAAEGAVIVGGHSSMGDEMTIGFSVTGLVKTTPITLAGARPGDHLILTKPLGTGVILAAEMRGATHGEIVAQTWDQMSQSSGDAARILAPKAHAMTDVTGFGLAGHLLNICRASDTGSELWLNTLPILDGALDLLKKGQRSTLHDPNKSAIAERVNGLHALGDGLLFDPQTAGGLLAAVPASEALALNEALQAAGYKSSIIGRIIRGSARIDLVHG